VLLSLLQLEGTEAQGQHAHLVREIVKAPAHDVVLERFHRAS